MDEFEAREKAYHEADERALEGEEHDDIIDVELSKLLDSLLDEDELEDDEAYDQAYGVVIDVIGELVDNEKVEEIPPEDADEAVKKKWIEEFLPIIQTELKTALEDESEGEDEDSEDMEDDSEE